MQCIIAFIIRALLLTLYVVLGRYEHVATPLDVIERAVVTCLQVCLLGAAWVIFEVCAFVVRVLSRRAYARVSEHRRRGDEDVDDMFDDDLLRPSADRMPDAVEILPRAQAAPEPLRLRNSTPDPSCEPPTEPRFSINESDSDSDKPCSERSVRTDSAERPVTFASRLALGQYVAKVHVIGIVVWTTMLSIDYALSQTSFVFVLGMLLGNVAAVLTGSSAHPSMSFSVLVVYWGLSGTLVLLYLVRDGASALAVTEAELGMTQTHLEWSQLVMAVNVLLSPASCGFSWTFWMDARTLLEHYRTSLYTSVILSVPVLIFVRGTYLTDVLARYSTPWLSHVIVTEPVLKFMTIYAMTLSLDAENVVDMLVVNTSVVGACYIGFEPHDVTFNVFVGVLVAALLALHMTRLVRRVLLERSRQAKFVVTEHCIQSRSVRTHAREDTKFVTQESDMPDVYSHGSL
jgi:hypothetical protein